MVKERKDVWERITDLASLNAGHRADMMRLRALSNGGTEGLRALFGRDLKIKTQDIPVLNMMDSATTRLAQKLRRVPTVKVDPPYTGHNDSQTGKDHAELVRHLVTSYDERQKMLIQNSKVGRWLPTYARNVWVVEQVLVGGAPYPIGVLRDPFDCLPGTISEIDQQPIDLATVRQVHKKDLERIYGDKIAKRVTDERDRMAETGPWGGVILSHSDGTMRLSRDHFYIYEYFDPDGSWVMAEGGVPLEETENPLSGNRFVMASHQGIDGPRAAFIHVIGLQASMAKLQMLALIAAQDATLRETNISGEVLSKGGQYVRGRKATNVLTPGTRVDIPSSQVEFQAFNMIDRIERHIRIAANYPVSEDGISPNSFATGRGVDSLRESITTNVAEYLDILAEGYQLLDAKRLEWDQVMYPSIRKVAQSSVRGEGNAMRYRASQIKGLYRTRRKFGTLSSFDEASKIVTGLQLVQGNVIDVETMREEIDGLDNLPQVAARVTGKQYRERVVAVLEQAAVQGDARAQATLFEIAVDPANELEILKKYYTAQQPEPSPEEAALVGAGAPAGPLPDVTTVLSRLEQAGGAEGGVQTVGRL